MDACKLREILKKQYGISNEEEFELAVKESKGIDIGIFTTVFTEGSATHEQEEKDIA